MQLQFKRCTTKDLEELLQISRKTFIDAFEALNNPKDFWDYMNKTFSEKSMLNELNNKKSHFYFAYLQNDLVGYFKLNEIGAQTDINDKDAIELERIYVLKTHQGKQLGKHFLEKIVSLSKQKKAKYLWLGVWERNVDAIRFYERYGFTKFSEHPYPIGSDIQTDWLMKKEL